MFAGLAVCNVNALCAQYNADRYLSGTLETIDVQAMQELGDSAVPSLVRLVTEMDGEKDPKLKDQITSILRLELNALKTEKASVFSYSARTCVSIVIKRRPIYVIVLDRSRARRECGDNANCQESYNQ